VIRAVVLTSWKKKNPDFENIFSRVEQKLLDAEEISNTNSVDTKYTCHKNSCIIYFLL
jgi:hypothetical protein